VRHLWHRYGNLTVLQDVSFEVGPGEIFGFIGPNGAGKTTTIRVLATLSEPQAGKVEIDGVDVSLDPEAVRKIIGYMPDHAGVYERISVREYLEFFADAFRVPTLGIVDTVLELTDLAELADRVVSTLSKGNKQRLQLARILLHDPKVLILDEPASDLDPRARIEIRDLLLELRSLGKTILLSSHILTELSDVCTSVGILERGRLVVSGPIGEIAQRLEQLRAQEAQRGAPPLVYPGYAPGEVPLHAPPLGPPGPLGSPGGPHLGPPGGPYVYGQPAVAQAPQPGAPAWEQAGPTTQRVHGAPGASPYAPQGAYAPAQRPSRLKLRVLGPPDRAAFFLQGGPGLVDVRTAGGMVLVSYLGGDTKIAEIVQHLVVNGVGVVGLEPERNELERIFLEVTDGSRGGAPGGGP
jgi:ABC-2 type transport system ATP-binding protein